MAFFTSNVDRIDVPSAKCRLLQAVVESLLQKYGSTMGFKDVGAEIGISGEAARLRQFRIGDLPDRIPHLRESRWPTPTIALWLCGAADATEADSPPSSQRPYPALKRGRPRKFAASTATTREERQ